MIDEQKAVFEALHQAQIANTPVALATIVSTQGAIPRHTGSKMLVREDGSIVGTVGGGGLEALVIQEALAALADGQSRLKSYTLNKLAEDPGVCGGTAQIFIEPITLAPTLLVVGAGHVGKAVGELGKWLGFRVILCDDRAEWCNATATPGLDEYIVCPPREITQHIQINAQVYVVAVTRGVVVDVELLPPLLKTNAPYIGVIGSRRRWALTTQTIQEKHGVTEEQLQQIHSPIGLELQAETPKEIAISILAEIIALRRGATIPPTATP